MNAIIDIVVGVPTSWGRRRKTASKLGDLCRLCAGGNPSSHERGCPWNAWTIARAAENGHLECLRYAHERGCPWNAWTIERAAENGHLECLRYAHEHGCPWNDWTTAHSAKNGHLECLR